MIGMVSGGFRLGHGRGFKYASRFCMVLVIGVEFLPPRKSSSDCCFGVDFGRDMQGVFSFAFLSRSRFF